MRFIINQNPIPKARARVTRWGTYTPERTKDAMEAIALAVRQDKECPRKPLQAPLSVDITFLVAMPKSWSKKRREESTGAPCINRSDIDNYCKTILDALNGILWIDDSQIYKLTAKKLWSINGASDITIW